MKRTKHIDLLSMRKAAKPFAFKPLVVAVTAGSLIGCSDDTQKVKIYHDADQCAASHPSQVSECELAYKEAVNKAAQSGPKYSSMAACITDFGANNCGAYPSSNNQSYFMPFISGFMFSSILNQVSRSAPLYTSYSRRSPAYNNWVSTDGTLYGNVFSRQIKVNNDAFKAKPAVKRTMSRGGFGSTIAAKSNFSGKSSRGSWGG
ncbi:DUF1190 domain-containing protein [Gammaproteobacteria bacterium AS21]|jgi:uncharacterized protein YgiB involved in biofilm formation